MSKDLQFLNEIRYPGSGLEEFSFRYNDTEYIVRPKENVAGARDKLEKFLNYVKFIAPKGSGNPWTYKVNPQQKFEKIFEIETKKKNPQKDPKVEQTSLELDKQKTAHEGEDIFVSKIDKIATRLESLGCFKEAYKLDVIANTVEAATKTREVFPEAYTSAGDILKKYSDNPDIYVSFTKAPKLGVNPKSKYGNPIGIYAYPIKNVINEEGDIKVPFAGDRPYAQIIEHTKSGKYIRDISALGRSEYVDAINKLRNMFIGPDKLFKNENDFLAFQKEAEQDSRNKTDGGFLFYLIVRLAQKLPGNDNINQTKIWRDLGYNMIGDVSCKGIIHPSEPCQVVFLDKSSYRHVDQVTNKSYLRYKVTKNPEMILKDPYFIRFFPEDQRKGIHDKYPNAFDEVFRKDPTAIKYFPEDQRKEIHDKHVDAFNEGFRKYPSSISFFPEDQRKEIHDAHVDAFDEGFRKNPFNIQYFPDDQRKEIYDKHIDAFDEAFRKNPRFIILFPEDQKKEIYYAHVDAFNEGFRKDPEAIQYLPEDRRKEIYDKHVDAFDEGFKENPLAIKYFPRDQRKKIHDAHVDAFDEGFRKNPEAIEYFPEDQVKEIYDKHIDAFDEGFRKNPFALEYFLLGQIKKIHDAHVDAFDEGFRVFPNAIETFPEDQQEEIKKMHPSVWPQEKQEKTASGFLELTDLLDKTANHLEGLGCFKEAYKLDVINNTLEEFWKNNQATLFFDEMNNQEIKPEDAEKILKAYEEGADTEYSVSDVTGIDSFKCKKVLDEAQKRNLLNKTAAVPHPAWLANKVEIIYLDPNDKEIKRTEGRIFTDVKPTAFPNLWVQGEDGKWYLQQADEITVYFKSGQQPILENRLTEERHPQPGAEEIDMTRARQVMAPKILEQLNK